MTAPNEQANRGDEPRRGPTRPPLPWRRRLALWTGDHIVLAAWRGGWRWHLVWLPVCLAADAYLTLRAWRRRWLRK